MFDVMLDVPAPRVNDIVLGKRSITADTAVRLGAYFRLPPQFWMNLQADYDLRLAEGGIDLKKIKTREAAFAFPLPLAHDTLKAL